DVQRQGVGAFGPQFELVDSMRIDHFDEKNTPTLLGKLRLGCAGRAFKSRRLVVTDLDTGQTVLVKYVLNGDHFSRGGKRLFLGLGERRAEKLQGVGDALGLGRQRLKLNVFYLRQLVGRNAAYQDD